MPAHKGGNHSLDRFRHCWGVGHAALRWLISLGSLHGAHFCKRFLKLLPSHLVAVGQVLRVTVSWVNSTSRCNTS